ncbi:unnamed protein product [Miscanthus lutarioriparius]|uniref:Uncharacterized protein n=1 Tax=Miscanthus lutarioriparius TaxID=422564 RepID=A0A811RYU2_9POAL|nr:unnamed protein product [Miscanthus lutarioriparius]
MAKKAPEWWSHGECPAPASIHLDAAKGARRRRSNPRRCRSVRCRDGSLFRSRTLPAPPPGPACSLLSADGSRLASAVAAPSVQ